MGADIRAMGGSYVWSLINIWPLIILALQYGHYYVAGTTGS